MNFLCRTYDSYLTIAHSVTYIPNIFSTNHRVFAKRRRGNGVQTPLILNVRNIDTILITLSRFNTMFVFCSPCLTTYSQSKILWQPSQYKTLLDSGPLLLLFSRPDLRMVFIWCPRLWPTICVSINKMFRLFTFFIRLSAVRWVGHEQDRKLDFNPPVLAAVSDWYSRYRDDECKPSVMCSIHLFRPTLMMVQSHLKIEVAALCSHVLRWSFVMQWTAQMPHIQEVLGSSFQSELLHWPEIFVSSLFHPIKCGHTRDTFNTPARFHLAGRFNVNMPS